jgi:alpha-methylacyl-CoA racemase
VRSVPSLPLDGVRVLDLTRLIPGNYCTWLLASLGAEVIKVEDPGAGDYMRTYGEQVEGMGATHHVVNRGKTSIVLDLKAPGGRDTFVDLVRTADVVVESFRPGVLDRLGVGWAQLRTIRPSLVLASISAFGASGPLASTVGHDINSMAVAGLLHRFSVDGHPPNVPAVPIADLVGGGLVTALGTVALLLRARQTGEGGRVESSLADAVAVLPSLILSDQLAGGTPQPPGCDEFDGGRAWYRTYPVADRGYVSVGAVEARFFVNLCTLIGRPDLVDGQHDPGRQEAIAQALRSEFAGLTRAQVETKYAGSDSCVVLVNDMADVIASEHAAARQLFRTGDGLPFPVPAPPFVLDGDRPPERGPAPRQGQHTRSILLDTGFDESRVEQLLEQGVVEQRA